MTKQSKGLSPIGGALGLALNSIGQANLVNLGSIEAKWPSIVGPQLAGVSRPAQLKYRELTVWVKDPVWVDSMMYHKAEIIKKVNGSLGKEVIDTVRIVHRMWAASVAPEKVDAPGAALSEDELKRVDDAVAGVEDSELRSTFKRVMLKSARTEKNRTAR